MKVISTEIEGVYIIDNFHSKDKRGSFTKIYNDSLFKEHNLNYYFKESFYSISDENVIRGLHFQLPPSDHEKLVSVPKGKILDIIFDLRKESATFGKGIKIELSEYNHKSIYIPKGLAHGFKSLENGSITIYNVTEGYNPDCDFGIYWDSIEMDWDVNEPIISERDMNLISFEKFKTINPFFK